MAPMNPNRSLIQPEPLVQKIGASLGDDAKTEALHMGPANADSARFDWEMFWNALSERPFRKGLYARHHKTLYQLHLLDCVSFAAYVKFLLSADGSLDSVVGADRRCYQPLPPVLVGRVVEAISNDKEASKGSLIGSLELIKKETERSTFRGEWPPVLEKNSGDVEKIGQRLVEQEDYASYASLVVTLRHRFNSTLYPVGFLSTLLQEPKAIAAWFQTPAKSDAVSDLDLLVQDSLDRQSRLSLIEMTNLIQAMAGQIRDGGTLFTLTGIGFFPESLRLARKLTATWSLDIRISLMDEMLRAVEASVLKKVYAETNPLFEHLLSRYANSDLVPYLQWLTLRLTTGETRNAAVTQLKESKFESSDPLDQLLFDLNQIYAAKNRRRGGGEDRTDLSVPSRTRYPQTGNHRG